MCGIPQVDALTQLASELLVHHVIAQVRDVTDHAGDAQAAFWNNTVLIEMATMEIGIGHDRAARHFVEGDVLGREIGRTGHHHGVADPARVLQRPGQCLHAAK